VIVGEKFKPLPPQMDAIWNCQDSPIAEGAVGTEFIKILIFIKIIQC